MKFAKLFWRGAAIVVGLALGGCFVSDDPLLDAKSGRARVLSSGDYVMCPFSEGQPDGDCDDIAVSRDRTGLYTFTKEGDDDVYMRFRRIARGAYVGQQSEGDDGFLYYYVSGGRKAMTMRMLMCDLVSDAVLEKLESTGDLAREENGSVCEAKSRKAIVAAARYYHQADVVPDAMRVEFSRK